MTSLDMQTADEQLREHQHALAQRIATMPLAQYSAFLLQQQQAAERQSGNILSQTFRGTQSLGHGVVTLAGIPIALGYVSAMGLKSGASIALKELIDDCDRACERGRDRRRDD